MQRCLQAKKDLERIVYQPTTSPDETLYFLAHWELLALLHGLLRLRHFLEFFRQNLREPVGQGLVERLPPAGPMEVAAVQVWDFFQAWRQEYPRRTREKIPPDPGFTRTPPGRTAVKAHRKEVHPHDLN
jgi:hypothetical protein